MPTYTTSTTLTDNILPEVIGAAIQDAIYSESVMLPLMRVFDLSAQPTLQVAVQTAPVSTAAATSEDAMTVTAWTPTNQTISVAEYGVTKMVTRLAESATADDVMAAIVRNCSSALYEAFETSATALLTGFTGGSQNVTADQEDLNAAELALALANLRSNAKGLAASRSACFVLHPIQVYDVQVEGFGFTGTTRTGAGLGSALARQDIVNIYGSGSALVSASVGNFCGVPVFAHNLCPLADTNTNRVGALFLAGEALGAAIKWMPTVEIGSLGSSAVNGRYMMATMAYGVGELRDLAGVTIKSDA